jgi:hypothetical protein
MHQSKRNKHRSGNLSENKVLRNILIALIILSLGVLIGTISYTVYKNNYYKNKVIEYRTIDAFVEVVKHGAGLNGDTDALRFGKSSPGSIGTRYIDINSSVNAIVDIYVNGDMAKFLSVDNNHMTVASGDDMHIPVYVIIPVGTQLGNYSGKIHIVLTKP